MKAQIFELAFSLLENLIVGLLFFTPFLAAAFCILSAIVLIGGG